MSRLAYAVMIVVAAAACGPSRGADGDAGADVIGGTCANGTTRCDGNQRLACENEKWVVADTCPNVCVDSLGCVLCEPGTWLARGQAGCKNQHNVLCVQKAHSCLLAGWVFCCPHPPALLGVEF